MARTKEREPIRLPHLTRPNDEAPVTATTKSKVEQRLLPPRFVDPTYPPIDNRGPDRMWDPEYGPMDRMDWPSFHELHSPPPTGQNEPAIALRRRQAKALRG